MQSKNDVELTSAIYDIKSNQMELSANKACLLKWPNFGGTKGTVVNVSLRCCITVRRYYTGPTGTPNGETGFSWAGQSVYVKILIFTHSAQNKTFCDANEYMKDHISQTAEKDLKT